MSLASGCQVWSPPTVGVERAKSAIVTPSRARSSRPGSRPAHSDAVRGVPAYPSRMLSSCSAGKACSSPRFKRTFRRATRLLYAQRSASARPGLCCFVREMISSDSGGRRSTLPLIASVDPPGAAMATYAAEPPVGGGERAEFGSYAVGRTGASSGDARPICATCCSSVAPWRPRCCSAEEPSSSH